MTAMSSAADLMWRHAVAAARCMAEVRRVSLWCEPVPDDPADHLVVSYRRHEEW